MGRTLAKIMVPAAALFALACGSNVKEDQASRDALSRDLEMVSAKGLELASARSAPATQIVSDIERTPLRAPRQGSASHSPKKARVPVPAPVIAPPAEPPVAEVAEVVQPTVVAQAPTPEVVEAPAPAAEPMIVPVSYPTGGSGDEGRGGGRRGGGLGGIFGVIIRGGSAGVDHCERHPGGRGGMVLGGSTIAINQRMPVIRPTF